MPNPKNREIWVLFLYLNVLPFLALHEESPPGLITGLLRILAHPGILVSDYFGIGGTGAALLNAYLIGIIGWALLWKFVPRLQGEHIAAWCTMIGFAFFGKNLLNTLPILFGCYLFSFLSRRHFSELVAVSMFTTALSPVVSLLIFDWHIRFEVAILVGVMVGLVVPALARHLHFLHLGYNLYSTGFAAGIVGAVVASVIQGMGRPIDLLTVWTENKSNSPDIILLLLLSSLIVMGTLSERNAWRKWKEILLSTGKAPSDYFSFSQGGTLINMAWSGLTALVYLKLLKAPINGPTLGGILTIVGFAAYGKHPRNALPIMFGVFLGTLITHWRADQPGPLLAALFGSALAPIAGEFGVLVGMVCGFLHLCVAMNVGWLHGGINLYNNGFAAGFVAIIIAGIAQELKRIKKVSFSTPFSEDHIL